jgi:hypothetical protein
LFFLEPRSYGIAVAAALAALPLAMLQGACTTTTIVAGADAASDGSGSTDATPRPDSGDAGGAGDAPGSEGGGGDGAPHRCVFDRDGSAFDKGCTFGP